MVGQGWATPLEFWGMTPGQVWWLVRARMPKSVTTRKETNAELYRLLKEAKAKEGAAHG